MKTVRMYILDFLFKIQLSSHSMIVQKYNLFLATDNENINSIL